MTPLAEISKPPARPVQFKAELSRAPRGIMLRVTSPTLHEHLRLLADSRRTTNSAGREVWNIAAARLRGSSLFTFSDIVTALLLDCALDTGHEVRVADVMTAPAAKTYVQDIANAFSEYVRDHMAALRISVNVTIDETVVRRAPITETV